MRINPNGNDRLRVYLTHQETAVLLTLLKLYPRVPPAHHRLSKTGTGPDASSAQQLLDEALAEQRAANKLELAAMFADPKRFRPLKRGSRLALTRGDLEWFLQVLNDIRVGSWILLGSPDERIPDLNTKSIVDIWAMEMAGAFQMQLLEALTGDSSKGHA